jgi:hypothetical protein
MEKGILIGSDSKTEWLLPWWWKYYSLYNDFPVAFADFGMSSKMRSWCKKRGEVIDLKCPKEFTSQKKSLPKNVAHAWQSIYKGDVWQAREAWFKKPLACLQTPFDMTVWMDTDCEVCGSLKPLFEEWEEGIELALVRDERSVEEHNYSSGVMLFQKNVPIIQAWAELCLTSNQKYMGDQNALTDLLLTKKFSFKELSPIYNWIMFQGYNVSVVVAHWGAGWGKEHIQRFGGLHDLLQK